MPNSAEVRNICTWKILKKKEKKFTGYIVISTLHKFRENLISIGLGPTDQGMTTKSSDIT